VLCAFPLPGVAGAWHNPAMAVVPKVQRAQAAPALFRLLSESAVWRGALEGCAFPVALLAATQPACTLAYVNAAFVRYFGWSEADALGSSPARLLFRGDEAALQKLLADPGTRWQLSTPGKDGEERHVELVLGAVRSVEGKLTHWVLSFQDCSELERLRGDLEKLRALAATP
jgi:PAS domain S-box-containing protein